MKERCWFPLWSIERGEMQTVEGILTTEHSAASYGRPVVVHEGYGYGPDDIMWIDGDPECLTAAARAGYHLRPGREG